MNFFKYVWFGGGFEFNFMFFEKCEVNGVGVYFFFVFLWEVLLVFSDDVIVFMIDFKFIIWFLVCCNDVVWNFEKFLVGFDGVFLCRYSCCF